jgi:hypothetical protein
VGADGEQRHLAEITRQLAVWPPDRTHRLTLRDLADLYHKRGDLIAADATLREALHIFGSYGSREYTELTRRQDVHAGR